MPISPRDLAVLRVQGPSGDQQILLVDRPTLQIGATRGECGLVLAGRDVAGNHCCLRWHDDRWVLYDRGSSAGTYLNNRRCREPTGLVPGDRISIGLHLLHFTTLPSLDLPHVLARLHAAPISWTVLQPDPAPPPPPARTRRRPPTRKPPPARARRVALAAAAALTLTVAARAGQRQDDHLSSGTSTSAAPAASDPEDPEPAPSDLSFQTLTTAPDPEPAPSDLSFRTLMTVPAAPEPAPSDLSFRTLTAAPASAPEPAPSDLSFRTLMTAREATAVVHVTEPPMVELPSDAVGVGRPTDGALVRGLRLPDSPDYIVRCGAHAHGTTATIGELMRTFAGLRNAGYTGELVVGDVSLADGGPYGPHKSHQSGRDVDVWLPIRGGQYVRGCPRCGTDLCRPEPNEVDWQATWALIQALDERGAVQDIFLDWTLHPALKRAARELGVPDDELARKVQHPVRGRATLIKHSAGHVHHLHVRFREEPAV